MNLLGRVAVVTGATGGIGTEIVKRLDGEGVTLLLISRKETELQELLNSLKNKESKYYVCDLSIQEETEKIANEISSNYPKIDILLNSAGVGVYKPIEEATLSEFNDSLNIGLTSTFILTKKLMSSLNNSQDSLVLNIGSGAGTIPMAGRSLYCTTKFALRGLTLSLAEEFKRIGNPKFCLITLGSTLTSFGPMSLAEKKQSMENGKGYLTPEWVAQKIVEIIKLDKQEVEYNFSSPDYPQP